MTEPELLTVAEAAQTLRVSPRTVYNRVRAGELPALRLGSGPKAPIRIDPLDLARFLVPDDTRGRLYLEHAERVERR
ncbi:MAG TPA: helix-turn-helix domain-containing protein [Gaiellaceae bacterium]|nr:helix-turn-helix domain-containing protein [Gaiellaceae bacterium]